MARIREYTPQTQAATGWLPQPEARPGDFGGIGTGLSAVGAGLHEAADTLNAAQQRQEALSVFTKTEMLDAQRQAQFAELAAKAEPGDTSFADKFMETLSNDLSSLGDGISTVGGRTALARASAQIMAQYTQRVGQTNQHLAGVKAISDARSGLDAMASSLVTDPSQFASKLATLNGLLADRTGPFGNIPSDKRDEFGRVAREQMAASAVRGMIRQSPDAALRQLQDGKWDAYLTGGARNTLENQAETGIRARQIEEIRLEARREKSERKAEQETENSLLAKLYAPDGLSTQEVLDAKLTPEKKRIMLGLIEKKPALERLTTDPATFMDLFAKIHSDQIKDEKELYPFVIEGKLTVPSLNQLRAEMQGRGTEEGKIEDQQKNAFVAAAKSAITGSDPLLHIRDPKGDAKFSQWLLRFLGDYSAGRKANKTPMQLLDEKSPDYIGKTISGYRRSRDEMMRDLFDAGNANVSAPPPIAPPMAR